MRGSVYIILFESALLHLVFTSGDEIIDTTSVGLFSLKSNTTIPGELSLDNVTANGSALDERVTTTDQSVLQTDGSSGLTKSTYVVTNLADSPKYPSDKCPKDDENSVMFPHPKLPGIFYKCSHGVAYEFSCPSDLVYNPALSICDWNKCPKVDMGTAVMYAHPTLPDSFYQCSHGVAYQRYCPSGLIYNPDLSVCDWK